MAVLLCHIGGVSGLDINIHHMSLYRMEMYANTFTNHHSKMNERTCGVCTFNALCLTAQ